MNEWCKLLPAYKRQDGRQYSRGENEAMHRLCQSLKMSRTFSHFFFIC